MKIIMALVVLLFANLGLYAQAKIAVITGEVFDRQSTYAYLRADKKVYSCKIVGGRFEFNLPNVEGYKLGTLFLWYDSLSNENVQQMLKTLDYDSRSIAIENLHVVVGEVTQEALIKGGQYNFELDQMFICLKDKSYSDFFTKYPNSPVSLTLQRVLINLAKAAPYFRSELTLKIYFNELGDGLKESAEGKKLWAMIAPMYKN